jgi:hypothetical protein
VGDVFVAIWHGGPLGEAVRRASLWWLRPAGDTLAAEKQVPRDKAARNDKSFFGDRKCVWAIKNAAWRGRVSFSSTLSSVYHKVMG